MPNFNYTLQFLFPNEVETFNEETFISILIGQWKEHHLQVAHYTLNYFSNQFKLLYDDRDYNSEGVYKSNRQNNAILNLKNISFKNHFSKNKQKFQLESNS